MLEDLVLCANEGTGKPSNRPDRQGRKRFSLTDKTLRETNLVTSASSRRSSPMMEPPVHDPSTACGTNPLPTSASLTDSLSQQAAYRPMPGYSVFLGENLQANIAHQRPPR